MSAIFGILSLLENELKIAQRRKVRARERLALLQDSEAHRVPYLTAPLIVPLRRFWTSHRSLALVETLGTNLVESRSRLVAKSHHPFELLDCSVASLVIRELVDAEIVRHIAHLHRSIRARTIDLRPASVARDAKLSRRRRSRAHISRAD